MRLRGTWANVGADLWRLALESSVVVCQRTLKIAAGDAAGLAEAHEMVCEKIGAVMTLQAKVAAGALGATPIAITSQVVTDLRRRVRANRRRLSRAR